MKRAGQYLLGLCFVLLFILCAATLVEGPETALPPHLPVHAAWAEASVPDAAQVPLRLNGNASRETIVRSCAQASVAAVMPVRESNGVPLTGKSWVRTVYVACPPEDEVG